MDKPTRKSAFPILACAAMWSHPPLDAQEPSPATLAIIDVGVVDVLAARVLPDRTVIIEADRIVAVATDAQVPAGARVIDGRGKFLMPGLWDMHVHLRHPVAPTILMPQFIAHGVTGVREMASGCEGTPEEGEVCLARMLEWRREIEAGSLRGPRLLALSSATFNPPWDYELGETAARERVREYAERGAEVIKSYYRLSPAAFRWVAGEAGQLGLAVGGHLPLRMTAAEASNAGLRSLEHARDFLFDCFPGSAEFRRTARSQNPPIDVMRSMVEDHDPATCEGEFDAFVGNDTWYVPTHVTRRMDAYADDPAFRDDPRKRYLPGAVWESWQADADRMVALDPSPAGRRTMRGFYEKGLEITGRAHTAGVGIVLGTDAGDTYVFPGSGAHDELGELVKAGLSPGEALSAATIRAAQFLDLDADYGTVAPGKRADLLLLNANPVERIDNIREIEMVIFGGEPLDRGELDGLLLGVEEAIAAFESP